MYPSDPSCPTVGSVNITGEECALLDTLPSVG